MRWAAAALVVAATIAWDPTHAHFGLLGALVGLLLELTVVQAGLALGAVLFGLRIHHVTIGIGGEVKAWTTAQRRIVLRNIPVLMSLSFSGLKPRVRLRTVLAGVASIVVTAAFVAVAWLLAGPAFWTGVALAASACFVIQLVPIEKPTHTSLGWFVFRLPKVTGRPLGEMEARPQVLAGMDAYHRGDIDTAERIHEELAASHPDLLTVVGLKVVTTCAREKYLEALQVVIGLGGRKDLTQRELAFVMATTAGVAAQAVESGQFPQELGLQTAKNMLENAYEAGYPQHRSNGTLALIALIEGETDKARKLATWAAESSEQALGRADELITIARAYMADGDNAKAREFVAEAHELAGWYPRVAATRARLNVT